MTASAWMWLLQRLTAALALIFLIAHLWAVHFAMPRSQVTFEGVRQRLQSPYIVALDLTLLAVVLYHALYGIRGIVIDLGVRERWQEALSWGLVALGVLGYLFGANGLLAFLGVKGLF